MNWNEDVSYNAEAKERFHQAAKRQLRKLADALGLERGQYDLRSNKGGIAVSGEVTLHSDSVYVQASQSPVGMLVRSCKGRKDYTGGHNYFQPLARLDEPEVLAEFVERVVAKNGY